MVGKRPEAGGTGSVIFVAVVAGLLWWKWDSISSWPGSTLSMGSGTVAEVAAYQCDQSGGRVRVDDRVRNVSASPIGLRAATAIYDSSGKKSDYLEAVVRPSPVPPGQVGDFRASGGALPDGGYCKLDGFLDADTGRPVSYSGHPR